LEFLIKRYLASLPNHQEKSISDKQAIGSPSSKELSAYLSGQLSLFPKDSGVTNLQWNRNKVDFIELFVALYESNSIKASDQHKLTKKEFIQVLMWFFNIQVGHWERTLLAAKGRKMDSESPFLKELVATFSSYCMRTFK
jgi:hypothetical protein